MKNYKLIINCLLVFSFVFSVIIFSLIVTPCHNALYELKRYQEMLSWSSDVDILQGPINAARTLFLETLFSIIFSALSAAASAVTFCLLNFKMWKKSEELKKD